MVDAAGNLYIADDGNAVIRRVAPDGTISSLVGGPTDPGYSGDNGPATGAQLNSPKGVTVDGAGNLYIADSENQRIRKVDVSDAPDLSFQPTQMGSVSSDSPQTTTVENLGNQALTFAGLSFPADFQQQASGGTDCPVTLSPDATCAIAIDFKPVEAGNLNETLQLQDNAVNAPQSISLQGLALPNGGFSETFSWTNVGSTSTAQSVTLTLPNGGTVNAVQVLTQGTPNLDFQLASGTGSDTCTSNNFSPSGSCQVNITFKPRYPGLRMGAVVLVDSGGNVLATDYISGVGRGPLVAFDIPWAYMSWAGVNGPMGVTVDAAGNVYIADTGNNQVIETLPGGGNHTTLNNGLNGPQGVAVDGAGNVYIADTGDNQVVMVPPGGGNQTTFGGLNGPQGVAVDGAGNVYIADTGNNQVVMVPVGGGGQATLVTGLNGPRGVAVDGAGNVYVADTGHSQVVMAPPGGGSQTTICTGSNSPVPNAACNSLSSPSGVAVDAAGIVYIADSGNNGIVQVLPGGGGSIAVGSSAWCNPSGIAVDGPGNIYLASTACNDIVEINRSGVPLFPLGFAATPVGSTSSDSPKEVRVEDIGNQSLNFTSIALDAGDPNFILSAGQGACTSSTAVAPGTTCSVWVSFAPLSAASSYPIGQVTLTDNAQNSPQTIPLHGVLATQLMFTAAPPAVLAAGSSAGVVTVSVEDANGNVAGGASVAVTLAVTGPNGYAQSYTANSVQGVAAFDLSSVILSQAGSYTYTASGANLTSAIAVEAVTTGTTLASTSNPSYYGQSVTFTATVSGATTGTMSFYDGATLLGTQTVSGGTAALSISTLTAGSHTIQANYSGGALYGTSSGTLTQTVDQASSPVALTSSENPSTYGASVQFTATVPADATGNVTFYDGDVAFTDGAFDLNNYQITTYNPSSLVATAVQNPSAGNPGAALEIQITFPAPQGVTYEVDQAFVNTSFTYNPATQGAIASISASVDKAFPTAIGGATSTFRPLIEQNGNYYLGAISGPSTAGFTTIAQAGLTAADFQLFDYTQGQFNAQQHPDFSASGSSLQFGLASRVYNYNSTTVEILYDNLAIVVHPAQASTLGAAAVSNGAAALSVSTLGAGTHTISATYSGDSNYNSSTGALTQSVTAAATMPVLTLISPNSGQKGQLNVSVAITGQHTNFVQGTTTVSFGAGVSVNSVTVTDATDASVSINIDSAAALGARTVTVTTGAEVVTAVNGFSVGALLTITADNQTVTYGGSLPSLTYSVSPNVTLDTAPTCVSSANGSNNAGIYAGAIACSGAVKAGYTITYVAGTLTVTPAPLTVTANNASMSYGGTMPAFTASYNGFVNNDASSVLSGAPSCSTTATSTSPAGITYPITCTQGTLAAANYSFIFIGGTLAVNQATPTVTWTTPAAITYGTSLAGVLNASTTVAGSFAYSNGGAAVIGTTVLAVGSYTLTATFTPMVPTDYTTATQTVSLTVNKATPAITWATPAAITYGTALSSTQLTASSGNVGGTFVYNPPAGTIPATGTDTLSATFTPTDTTDYTTATQTVSLTVNKTTPGVAVTAGASTVVLGGSTVLTATVSVSQPAGSAPSGSVVFYNGASAIGSSPLTPVDALHATASMTVSTSQLALGNNTITASYSGDSNYSVNSTASALAIAVNLPVPSISGYSFASAPSGASVALTGTGFVSPYTLVQWNGVNQPTTWVSSTQVAADISSALLGGEVTVTAFNPTPGGGLSNTVQFDIPQGTWAITDVQPHSLAAGSAQSTLTVTGTNLNPTIVVRFNGQNRPTQYISSSELQATLYASDLATPGTVTVQGAASGGATVSPAIAFAISDFTPGVSPASATVAQGESASFTITLAPQFGAFNNSVALSCSNLPVGAACSFSPATLTPGANGATSTLTITTGTAASAALRRTWTRPFAPWA